ncbi:hypothetical protein D3C78_1919070 [compost metagenome]
MFWIDNMHASTDVISSTTAISAKIFPTRAATASMKRFTVLDSAAACTLSGPRNAMNAHAARA